MFNQEFKTEIREQVIRRFKEYVAINTTSDEESSSHPSTYGQRVLAERILNEVKAFGITDYILDELGYLYFTLPASGGCTAHSITFCSHFDTSPDEPGEGIIPVFHENYQGGNITFPKNPNLILNPDLCPELLEFIGETIITSQGDTLLGADDKAGIAEIMTAVKFLLDHPEIKRPELRIIFTPDEEIGQGTDLIKLDKVGKIAYTLDGGMIGEIENECFNAYSAKITFNGINNHPGYSKNVMVNAIAIAARFTAAIPESETPEHTEKREGFYHIQEVGGDENTAHLKLILRDFENEKNQSRVTYLKKLAELFRVKYPKLEINVEIKSSYKNMREVLDQHPEVVNRAIQAITEAGISPLKAAVRGGTDGARLCFSGIPTPNLFAGGMLFHSKREWIPEISMVKAVEVIIRLTQLWAE